jgi:AAA15 family ATPase/GTPase
MKFEDVDYHNFALLQKKEIKIEFYFDAKEGWKEKLLKNYDLIATTKYYNDQNSYEHRAKVDILNKILSSNLLPSDNSSFSLMNEKNSIGSPFQFIFSKLDFMFQNGGLGKNGELKKIYSDFENLDELKLKGWNNFNPVAEKLDSSSYVNFPFGEEERIITREQQIFYLKGILSYLCDFILDYSGYFESYFKEDFGISLIPAIREIGNPGTTFDEKKEFNGQGLIDGLAELQHPANYFEQQKKEQFEKINQFLRAVTDNESAKIEIPHDKSKILVEMDGKILPLQSLGTGIHEVIILAAAATIKENQVICMEEPELHLHPLLQKKLISYLTDETNNQYFITTHSAHFLDTLTPDFVSIFHVNYENGCSIVNRVETDNHKTTVLSDLGYKPSDLLQTNCVIWVEGPSDRIYLNYWIQCFSKDLKEKIHYTIMFYGGGLLSHLSVSDAEDENDSDSEDLNDFISLREINRNTVIMCDSDRANEKDFLKPAIDRIKLEFDKGEFPGFHWITDGREVENYLNPDIVEENIKNIHHNVKKIIGKTIYDHVWKYESSKPKKDPTADKKYSNADKVKLARGIVESESYSPPSEDKFKEITNSELENSLRDWIKGLISFIHKSNGIKSNEI